LVEKAQEEIDEKEAENMLKNLEKRKFTIDDFLKQMNTMNKLGNFSSLMKMIPGMGGLLRNVGDLSPAEAEMTKMKVMISSMTKEERKNDHLLNDSRKRRVAKGSGTSLEEVRQFLNKFEQMRGMMIGMMDMMKGGGGPMEMMARMGMGGGGGAARKGFRNPPQNTGKMKKKGKGKGPFGGGFF
jgi:signal recognition particle subunit SRP54